MDSIKSSAEVTKESDDRARKFGEQLGVVDTGGKVPLPGTTPTDALDVMNRLVEVGKWEEVYRFATDAWIKSGDDLDKDPYEFRASVTAWLFSRDSSGVYRICELAGEWLKEEGHD